MQPASDFFEVSEEKCRHNFYEEIDDWPLIDPRNIICEGREEEVRFCLSITMNKVLLLSLCLSVLISSLLIDYLFVQCTVQVGYVGTRA